jgi:hypothetical protein
MTKNQDQKEAEQRLGKILEGAFSGPATPLKDIPTRFGEKRKSADKRVTTSRKRQQKETRHK